jgi:hypothetical protein
MMAAGTVGTAPAGTPPAAATQALAGTPPAAAAQAPAGTPRTSNTQLVGHLAPGPGPYADVWVHDGTAYLGSYRNKACAAAPNGVTAIDVRNPARPRLLGQFGRFPGSDDQDVWVGRVRTRSFSGDLAAVGVQACSGQTATPRFVGLALFDVSDPARPKPLGRLATGTRAGVHELGVAVRPDGRVLVLAAVPGSFPLSKGASGDLRIIDVTDPRRPREIADWDVRRDGPAELRARLATRPDVFCHSAWPFAGGNKLFASFWASGVLFLDIADPARPTLVGRTTYRPEDRSPAAHSGWFNQDETLFVQNDEALGVDTRTPGAAWPYQRIWDTRTLSEPKLVGTFATEAAVPGRDGRIGLDGFYSVHNAVIDGTLEYVSWYSDGVRVVDLSDPARPREVGHFVPPPHPLPDSVPAERSPDGRRTFPLVWGVHTANGLVFASDIGSGLWIFRFTRPQAGAGQPQAGAGQGTGAATAAKGGGGQPGPRSALLGAGVAVGLLAAGGAVAAVRRSRRRRRAREVPPAGRPG